MTIQSGEFDGGDFADAAPWWSGDQRPLDHLLQLVAPGSRLVFEFQPMARIKGQLGFLEIAPCVGIVRYADRHESITGLHFIHGDRKCLLNFDEVCALLKLLELWTSAPACSRQDQPAVKSVHFETRGGLIIESVESMWREAARISVASPVTILLSGSQLEKLLRECQRIKVFLDQFRS